jgi:hypothetical protein
MLAGNALANAAASLDGNAVGSLLKHLSLPWIGDSYDLLKRFKLEQSLTSKKLVNALRRAQGALLTVEAIRVTLPKERERQGVLRGKRLIVIDHEQAAPLTFNAKVALFVAQARIAQSAPPDEEIPPPGDDELPLWRS